MALVFFGDTSSSEYKNVFLKAAIDPKVSEKFNFYHSSDKECATSFGAKDLPAFVLFRKFDESPLVFNDNVEVASLTGWMSKSGVPTVIEFSEDFIEPIFGERKDAIILFRDNEDADSDFSKEFGKSAGDFKGEVLFVVSGIKDGI